MNIHSDEARCDGGSVADLDESAISPGVQDTRAGSPQKKNLVHVSAAYADRNRRSPIMSSIQPDCMLISNQTLISWLDNCHKLWWAEDSIIITLNNFHPNNEKDIRLFLSSIRWESNEMDTNRVVEECSQAVVDSIIITLNTFHPNNDVPFGCFFPAYAEKEMICFINRVVEECSQVVVGRGFDHYHTK